MKLISLQLFTSFRGLQQGFNINFKQNTQKALVPKCIVGMNGNGKSNLIELLCEIFYSLEIMHLNYSLDIDSEEFNNELDTISYQLVYSMHDIESINEEHIVCVYKAINESPTLYLLNRNGKKEKISNRNLRKQLLPTKIIGYSSGHNELISVPFTRMKYNYFSEYQLNSEEDNDYEIEHSRLFYMNNEINSLILICNYLLGDISSMKQIYNEINIDKLQSFRIRLRLLDYTGDIIKIDSHTNIIIDKLLSCATCYENLLYTSDHLLILDYFVDTSVINTFKDNFGSSESLFKSLYMLYSLNIFSISKRQQYELRKSVKATEFAGLLSGISSSELVFSIDDILLLKKDNDQPIHYNNLSDGEHQLIQTIGSVVLNNEPNVLFLFDEPETHFNPDWRAKFISLIDNITYSNEKWRYQEMILTTHSPFILSDSYSENIYKFQRNSKGIEVLSPDFNTYGSSISVILNEIFDQKNTTSNKSSNALNKYFSYKSEDLSIEEINELRREVMMFGESPEKFEALSWLSHLKLQKTNQ